MFWGNHFADLANRHKARTQSPLSLCRFAKSYESTTAITSIVCNGALDSANRTKNTESDLLRHCEVRSAEAIQKNNNVDGCFALLTNSANCHDFATQNLAMTANKVDSASAESSPNNPCEAPLISPASWCKKSESKGAVVPPADFLLEADKRGTPPKSEKAAAFWEHNLIVGGSGSGVQPFLRKDLSESNIKNDESNADSAIQTKIAESTSSLSLRVSEANAAIHRICEQSEATIQKKSIDCHDLLRKSRNDENNADSANKTKNAESKNPPSIAEGVRGWVDSAFAESSENIAESAPKSKYYLSKSHTQRLSLAF
ncbi:hypothetical protein ACWIUD_06145 [Helicobacter sp. 23-1044]